MLMACDLRNSFLKYMVSVRPPRYNSRNNGVRKGENINTFLKSSRDIRTFHYKTAK